MTISFTKVRLPYGWLGNMSPHAIAAEGFIWPTAEHLFQALRFEDIEIRRRIGAEKSPMSAKMRAKSLANRMTIVERGEDDVRNMRRILRLKVEQHSDLMTKLLLHTGDEDIVEDVTRRANRGSAMFWGAAWDGEKWTGENRLGKLWMELRSSIREQYGCLI